MALVALVETKIKASSAYLIKNCFSPPCWLDCSNVQCDTSLRIWILRNPQFVSLQVLSMGLQYIHCQISFHNIDLRLTVCYGANNYIQRWDLWTTISNLSKSDSGPWLLGGDFNSVRWTAEKIGGASSRSLGVAEFNECINANMLADIDIHMNGPAFTWSNSSMGSARIEWKLDRGLGNGALLHASFFWGKILMPGLSDQVPQLFSLVDSRSFSSPFCYFNHWAKLEVFFDVVWEAWCEDVRGSSMFRVVYKLKWVKIALTRWRNLQQPIPIRVSKARLGLDEGMGSI